MRDCWGRVLVGIVLRVSRGDKSSRNRGALVMEGRPSMGIRSNRCLAAVLVSILALSPLFLMSRSAHAGTVVTCVVGSWGDPSQFDSYTVCDSQMLYLF